MTATDQLRAALRDLEAKARELELDKKLESFADQVDHYLHEAAVKAGDYAHDNRDRVEETLDKAGAKVDEKTDGKYTRYVEKLRTGVLVGVDWVAQQRESSSTPEWAQGTRWGGEPDAAAAPQDDVPPTAPTPSAGSADSADVATPADTPPAGSADSDAWVDVTDTPPPAQGPTDPQ
ncbi:MAG: Rv0909 family putative TA system antitoxin [Ornithinibacter sp.]